MRNRNWKDNGKDRKQYLRNGKCKIYTGRYEFSYQPTVVNTQKRNSWFMDLSDIAEEEEV